MKSIFLPFVFSAIASSTFAAPAAPSFHLEARELTPNDSRCIPYWKYQGIYNGYYEPSCISLTTDCRNKIVNTTSDIWSVKSCVAAATCQGVVSLISQIQCTEGGDVPGAPNTGHLNYNIYASIVGECAWQEGGCPITQQNYIDFVYGALSEVGTSSWPDINNVINNWWGSIEKWTATGETVPYLNFDDWLHYSNSGA
ncbi:hypothetical protein VKT23_019704 [Stygiomarasmius scandens]|uniref:Uncharacterized protein n=1 Tax=Marasmiellus scandens TaxID=2682957 RepID=A0ABR1IM91_9AGAR